MLFMRIFPAIVLVVLSGCSKKAPPAQAELEKQFEQMMTGVTLVGHSTRLNRDGVAPGEEKYVIEKVSKLTGETWLIRARMQYGSRDLPVPVPVTIKWAGDTPVITLTDLAIPGVGTYTARVLFYRDQYAGTWSAQKGGGQMFGKIVRSGK
jgi:hypothetical protein